MVKMYQNSLSWLPQRFTMQSRFSTALEKVHERPTVHGGKKFWWRILACEFTCPLCASPKAQEMSQQHPHLPQSDPCTTFSGKETLLLPFVKHELTPSTHQLFNTAFQCLLLIPHQYFHWLNKQGKAPKSFPQSLLLLYCSVLEMLMSCQRSITCPRAGWRSTVLQTETDHELVGQEWWGPQYMEGETSEPKFKQVWRKNSSRIPSQAELLQPQSSKEKNLAEIFFDT